MLHTVYIIHAKVELNTCSFRAMLSLTGGAGTNQNLSFEVNNIDYVKPLILAFVWVIFDMSHLLQTGLRSEQPPLQPPFLYCTQMDTAHMLAAECSYYVFSVSVGQMMVLVHFNSFKLINLKFHINVDKCRRMWVHADDDTGFSWIRNRQTGLCKYQRQLSISRTNLKMRKTNKKHKADTEAAEVSICLLIRV